MTKSECLCLPPLNLSLEQFNFDPCSDNMEFLSLEEGRFHIPEIHCFWSISENIFHRKYHKKWEKYNAGYFRDVLKNPITCII